MEDGVITIVDGQSSPHMSVPAGEGSRGDPEIPLGAFFLVVFSITQSGARSTHFLSPGASEPGLPGTAAPPTRRPSAPSWRPPAPHQLLGLARRCQPCVPAVPPPSSVRSSSCWHCGTCWHRQLCQHRVSADLSPSRGPLLRCGRASTPSSPALPGSLAPETGVGKQPYPF